MTSNPLLRRRSGILLHPTSLPSRRLDDDAQRWLDFLAAAGQGVWQVLPLGMPCRGYSPYQCLSAFAANPALLPLDSNLQPQPDDPGYRQWQQQQVFWLEDFADFLLLKQMHDGKPWYEWPDVYRHRRPGVLETLRRKHAHRLELIRWQQFQIYRTWNAIRAAAAGRDIQLFGDMPIFVAHDSADVWAAPERFLLDGEGRLTSVTGVPPDYFSATGQRWGNPHYNWQVLADEGFDWWLKRLQTHFQWFDLLRIDHFRGLEAVWMIEHDCPTAERGEWVKTPGDALLLKLQQQMGNLPLVAEDLGIITPAVTELRKRFNLPGMAVLQFAFDAFEDNPHKPRNITPDTVVYTGTHDNDTTLGWFRSMQPHEQQHVLETLGISDPAGVVEAMMNAAMQSRAQLCILPLQDVLGLDSDARMNLPGNDGDHWRWRFDWSQMTPDTALRLKEMSTHAQRS
ncbi:MAG: 4-alpha-glucanotransferase [Gammaproteobacteria bacterium]